MFLEGQCQLFGFALRFGVVAAHGALQFRKFTHHGGHQIGFGQFRGARHVGACADALADQYARVFTRRVLSA